MELKTQYFDSPNLRLSYLDSGTAEGGDSAPRGTILLLHGFGSTARVNWLNTGWIDTLSKAGFRCIAPDHRGHGDSTKFYSPDDYGPDIFARDSLQLLDHLGIEKCSILGFSMGSRITAWMCHATPTRFTCAIFGGMGICMIKSHRDYRPIADAFEVDDPSTITDAGGIAFRRFADKTGSDRLALAACIRPSKNNITTDILSQIPIPVLVAVGDKDEIGGSPHELAALLPDGRAVSLDGFDHMASTGTKVFKDATLNFLTEFHNAD